MRRAATASRGGRARNVAGATRHGARMCRPRVKKKRTVREGPLTRTRSMVCAVEKRGEARPAKASLPAISAQQVDSECWARCSEVCRRSTDPTDWGGGKPVGGRLAGNDPSSLRFTRPDRVPVESRLSSRSRSTRREARTEKIGPCKEFGPHVHYCITPKTRTKDCYPVHGCSFLEIGSGPSHRSRLDPEWPTDRDTVQFGPYD